MSEPSLVLEVKSQKTQSTALFLKLNSLYAECEFLIRDEEQLHPFICLKSTCHRGMSCMEKLAVRVNFVFDTFPNASLLFLYFRYRDAPKKHRAAVFYKDNREPKYITFNPYAWEKVKKMGTVYEWVIPPGLFLAGNDKLYTIGRRES